MADCACDNLTVGSNGLKINSGLAEPPASNTPWQAFKGTEFANLLRNGSFESWTAGTSSPPDGWTHTATYGTVARDGTTVKKGG